MHLGQIDFALKDISKSIEINPNFTSGYLTRAQIYRYLKKFDLAFQDLNDSLKIDPLSSKMRKSGNFANWLVESVE